MRRLLIALCLVVLVLAIATTFFVLSGRRVGIGERSGEEITVRLTNELRFEPTHVAIDTGDTVVWINESEKMHTVSTQGRGVVDPEDRRLPKGAEEWDSAHIAPGQSFKRTFVEPGLYRYYCGPHQEMGMVGEILVRPGPGERTPDGGDSDESGPS